MAVKIKLHKKEIIELLQSEEVAEELKKHAEATKANAEAASGEAYNIRRTKTDRAGYNVFPANKSAKQDNLKNNTLLKSIE